MSDYLEAKARQEESDRFLGVPGAGKGRPVALRCDLCGGLRFQSDDACERCGRTGAWVEERTDPAGRYAIDAVYWDGNPILVCRAATLLAALELRDAVKEGDVASNRRSFVGVGDLDDGERGWLTDESYVAGVDAGPDPLEA
jgi:hypothetical protein